MACKTTFIKSRSAGYTLVEMLVSLALGSLVLMSVLFVYIYTGRSFAASANYVDLDRTSQLSMDHLSQQIRQVNKLTACNTTNLTFQDFDGQTLAFNYDPNQGTFTRVKTNESIVYLRDVYSMNFKTYQHVVQSGTLDAVTTSSITNCKLIEIDWLCARTVLGRSNNTESVRSAKIVIRRQQSS